MHVGEPDRTKDVDASAPRRRAMGAFAAGDPVLLKAKWREIGAGVEAQPVRGPEAGLVMLRGRIGGGGAAFNLGEASVTRATVRLGTGEIGHAMILARDTDRAHVAASLDAAWQRAEWRERIEAEIVEPVLAALAAADLQSAEETEATKVDFFTVVRGDD